MAYRPKTNSFSKAPVINAGVIIANLAWNKANNRNGMVGAKDQAVFGPTL
jgi:hypothetical protein